MRLQQIRLGLILLITLLLLGCQAKEPETTLQRLEGQIFGTFWQVTFATQTPDQVQTWRLGVEQVLQQVDAQMSTYRQDSELMQLNRQPLGEWFSLSPELYQVLALSQQIAEASHGQFDVTVGRLVNLWSFGPEQRPLAIPEPELLSQRLSQVGYQYLELQEDPPAARRMQDFYIDLSGVAKGFAVDEVARYLAAQGLENFLVNIGGDLLAKGQRASDQPWRIGIEVPHEGVQEAQHILAIQDMSVATSGDYRNYFEAEGVRFSHTIDPLSGWPIAHNLASVTVLAPDNAHADAWATALMVQGPEVGLQVAETENLKVLMIVRGQEGWETYVSTAMAAYLGPEKLAEIQPLSM